MRVKPDPERVRRAERVYQRLKAGKSPYSALETGSRRLAAPALATLAGTLILGLGALTTGFFSASVLLSAVLFSGVLTLFAQLLYRNNLKPALEQAREVIDDPLAAYIYTGRQDVTGEIYLGQLALRARLRTALGRFTESAKELRHQSDTASTQAEKTHQGMDEQRRETDAVVNAMQQMAIAVQEIAGSATQTSSATSEAIAEVSSGGQVIEAASRAIGELSTNVGNLSQVLDRLMADSSEIRTVVDVIRGIAEQTNLLALNAAIEAARAGEQGRGFAVVADEVRTLAQRTQDSTGNIQKLIGNLNKATEEASLNMDSCQSQVDTSVKQMANVRQALDAIVGAVNTIDQMSHQIAAAAEEQSVTAKDIESNTDNISRISNRTQAEIAEANRLNQEMAELSRKQFLLVDRFD
ncbi:methyl-accepting chemotaxis protein [Marinimicrobium alkaliphilum]|uniref:methyl-accepting chemotaxis protein n=1 Tax=Marinimicrobium alkaliphilum TaxID=2202654 RepID=UPI0038CC14B7